MKIARGDIFAGKHDVVAFGVNRGVGNDSGFCGILERRFGLSPTIFDTVAANLEVGGVFLLRLSSLNTTFAGLVIHEKVGKTDPRDVKDCIVNLKLLTKGKDVGLVAVGCGIFGQMPGGFGTLKQILKEVKFEGTVYEPRG